MRVLSSRPRDRCSRRAAAPVLPVKGSGVVGVSRRGVLSAKGGAFGLSQVHALCVAVFTGALRLVVCKRAGSCSSGRSNSRPKGWSYFRGCGTSGIYCRYADLCGEWAYTRGMHGRAFRPGGNQPLQPTAEALVKGFVARAVSSTRDRSSAHQQSFLTCCHQWPCYPHASLRRGLPPVHSDSPCRFISFNVECSCLLAVR